MPSATNTNLVRLQHLSFASGTASFRVYRGLTPSRMLRIASDQAVADTFTDSWARQLHQPRRRTSIFITRLLTGGWNRSRKRPRIFHGEYHWQDFPGFASGCTSREDRSNLGRYGCGTGAPDSIEHRHDDYDFDVVDRCARCNQYIRDC